MGVRAGMMDRPSICERINRVREQLDFSLQDLADASGLSKATVQKYCETMEPTASRADIIAKALGVRVQWLITGGGKKDR